MSGVTDFDFLLGSWNIRNLRRTNPFAPEKEGVWEEFSASSTSAKQLDGRVRVEQYEATLPNGELVQGMTIRAFDQETQQWSIVWLDNRNSPDFRPLLGHFEQGVGLFIKSSNLRSTESQYISALYGTRSQRRVLAGSKPSPLMVVRPGIRTGLWTTRDSK